MQIKWQGAEKTVESIWSRSCQIEEREPLPGDIETEIAVIGAGMAGVLIGSALREAGHRVVLLEANRIASGQTRNTTAKITSQHGMIYHKLAETFGQEKAGQYAMAQETAIREYRRVIREREIDCDFEEADAFVYGSDEETLRAETEAAASLGLPASFVRETALPFPSAGAVRFSGQAQFHPLKFLRRLAEPLTIYENTPVRTVENSVIRTGRGAVRAERIVFACHFPFVNFPGLYFARMHQERSYVLALENAPQLGGTWIGAAENAYSFRNYGNLLLLGGGGHRCGENREGGRYELLRRKAKEWFPDSRETACWSAQDCMPADGVPYIGRYAADRPNWFVATGFQKWGMTSSMVSAMLIRDLMEGTDNPWAEVFDPGRFDAAALAGIAQESGHAVKGLAKRFFQIPEEQAAKLPAGHGGVVSLEGEKVGVYKEEDGSLHTVEIHCRHLGCQLEWNPDERSWDCPCHGSRFDCRGKLISGPAQENLISPDSGESRL